MHLLKDKRFYKFLLPSLAGAFLFVTPISQNGQLTIPIAVAALFGRVEWTPVAHTRAVTVEEIYDAQ